MKPYIHIKKIRKPFIGPRGGLTLRASITMRDAKGALLYLSADTPGKWTERQWAMWEEVVGALHARFEVDSE